MAALGRQGEEAGGGGSRAGPVGRDHLFVAVEGVDVVVDPLQRHRQVQHAVVARRVLVARRQESCSRNRPRKRFQSSGWHFRWVASKNVGSVSLF